MPSTTKAACPFTGASSSAALDSSTGPVGSVPPGPAAFGLESLMDVSHILRQGLQGAMLHFESKYGPTCRFANPTDLNGASNWVFINSPENVQHVCMDNVRNYQRRYLPDVYKFATHEKGILGSQGEYNKRHRRMCQPPFANGNLLRGFFDTIVSRSQLASACLREAAGSSAASSPSQPGLLLDVSVQTQRLTLDIVGLTAFSHDFRQVQRMREDLLQDGSEVGAKQDRLLWAVNTFGEVLADVFITPMPLLRVMDKLGFQGLKKLSEASNVMRASMLDVISARRAELEADPDATNDLLKVLLAARDEDGAPLSDEELWEDIHDVMGAGHETTATTTAAVLYCIAAHPEVEARVRAELASVYGDGHTLHYEDLGKLTYLSQVVKEVLRLYPAIPVFPREASDSDVLASGHTIEAGDVVFMSSYALGRSPLLWEDPLEFNPDRFTPENEAGRHRFQWMPFGGGVRQCLGASFAKMSVTVMAASLLRELAFECPEGAPQLIPVGYDITMNYQPTGGLHMRCHAL